MVQSKANLLLAMGLPLLGPDSVMLQKQLQGMKPTCTEVWQPWAFETVSTRPGSAIQMFTCSGSQRYVRTATIQANYSHPSASSVL